MERRRHERWEIDAALRFHWKAAGETRRHGEGIARNMSAGGVFVSTNHPPSVGTRVRFRIAFSSLRGASTLVMDTIVEVVRVVPGAEGEQQPGFAGVLKTYTLRNEDEVIERESF